MSIPKFDEKELEVVGEVPENPMMPSIKLFKTPVTASRRLWARLRGNHIGRFSA